MNDMAHKLTVGVVIPWGKISGIDRCLHSAIAQSYKVNKIIVISNGAVDRNQFESLRAGFGSVEDIEFIHLSNCHNGNIARNIGVITLTTDLVAFLDSDDWWDRLHIEESIIRLLDTKAQLVYSGMRIMRPGGIEEKHPIDYLSVGGMRNYCLSYLPAPTSSLVAYRDSVTKIMWNWEMKRHQDYDFKARFCDTYLATYKENITVNVDWSERSRATAYSDCFDLLLSWRRKVDPVLYKNHYINLTKGSVAAKDYVYLKKIVKAVFYIVYFRSRKIYSRYF